MKSCITSSEKTNVKGDANTNNGEDKEKSY